MSEPSAHPGVSDVLPVPRPSVIGSWLKLAIFAVAFYVSAEVGMQLSPKSGAYVTFWLPAGLVTAVLLRSRLNEWPGFLAVAAIAHLVYDRIHGTPWPIALGFMAAHAVVALVGSWLTVRALGERPAVTTLAETTVAVFFSAVAGPAIGALVGAATLMGAHWGHDFWLAWLRWCAGDSMAVFLLAMFVLAWTAGTNEPHPFTRTRWRPLEATALLAGLCACSIYMLGMGGGILSPYAPLLMIFILWAAMRFGTRGATGTTLLLSLVTAYLTVHLQKGLTPSQIATGSYVPAMQTSLVITALIGLIPAIAIKERDRNTLMLRESENRLRSIFDAEPECVKLTELDGRLIDMNAAGLAMLEADSLDQVKGCSVLNLASPESRPAFMEAAGAVCRGESRVMEFELTGFRGTRRWLESHMVPLRDATGQIAQILTVTRDVTVQKRSLEALRQSEERFSKAFRSSPVAILFTTVAEGRIVDANTSFLRMLGYDKPEEVVGRTTLELRVWASPEERKQLRDRLIESGNQQHAELMFQTKSGSRGHALVSAELIELQGRQCVLSLLHDITDRKEAEERLRRSEQERMHQFALLEATLDSMTEGVVVSDLGGNLYYWNRSALKMHGYASLDECRRSLADFQDTFEFLQSDGTELPFDQWPLMRILRGEQIRDCELILHHKVAGSRRHYNYSGTIAKDSSGKGVLAVISMFDTTDRKVAEDQLRQSQKMEAIGQLSGGVAHDFNNLLTVITGHVSLLEMCEGLGQDQRDSVREIKQSALRAANLTRQLLLFSRRQVMRQKLVDLNEIVTNLAKMLQRIIGEDIGLQLNLHSTPLFTSADVGMLDQVLMNLAVNARDAMPQGGKLVIDTAERVVLPEEALRNPEAKPGRHAVLRMTDTGAGITANVMPHIFEPFFTTKDPGKGTGLGLSTVFGIIKQHRGWIEVHSEPGHGTTFQIHLPECDKPQAVAQAPDAAPEPRGGTETILLAEDEPAVRSVTRQVLCQQGYRVLEAGTGPEALALWEAHGGPIHLLLTDMVMPDGMTGGQLAEQLQQRNPALKVIFTTGYSPELAGRHLALKEGQNFLQKPATRRQMLETVRHCLDV